MVEALRLQFCFYAVRLLRALEVFTPLEEALRIFSAESTPTRTWTGSARG